MLTTEQKEAGFTQILDHLTSSDQPLFLGQSLRGLGPNGGGDGSSVAEGYTVEDWSMFLEGLTNDHRSRVYQSLDPSIRSAVLSEMREDARNQLLSVLPKAAITDAMEHSNSQQAIDIIDALPSRVAKRLINKLSPQAQSHLEANLSFNDSQVGRYANTELYTISVNATVASVLADIKNPEIETYNDSYIIIDEHNKYCGEVDIHTLLNADPQQSIEHLSLLALQPIRANMALLDASNMIRASKRPKLPVITEAGILIGYFSINDALDVFQEYYEAQISHMGKVSDEDLFAPIGISTARRAVWLGINLLTAFMASFVVGMFDKVVAEVVALAVLMPIVASMGGIAGSQTLTLTIRGLAMGQLAMANINNLRHKELWVTGINGVLWAGLVAVVVGYWFDNPLLSGIIAASLLINMLVAALFGILIPVWLHRAGIDPALAGSVILTTVTDVVGFFVFLGSASLLFLA